MRHLLFFALTLLGCTTATLDLEKERQLIIEQLIDSPNQALIDKDVEGAVSAVPEIGDVFIAKGDIYKRTKNEEREHMKKEIYEIEYLRFSYLTEPDIKIVGNGVACYGTAQLKIDFIFNSDTTRTEREFIYSILFVGEKQNSKWVMTAFSQSDKTVYPDHE